MPATLLLTLKPVGDRDDWSVSINRDTPTHVRLPTLAELSTGSPSYWDVPGGATWRPYVIPLHTAHLAAMIRANPAMREAPNPAAAAQQWVTLIGHSADPTAPAAAHAPAAATPAPTVLPPITATGLAGRPPPEREAAAAAAAPSDAKVSRSTPAPLPVALPPAPKTVKAVKERKRKTMDVDGKGDGERRKRKKRDADLPKLPTSAYLFFCASERPKLRAERPAEPMTELMKFIGARWRALSAADRKPFDDAATADQQRFSSAMAAHALRS
jgi:hypothetical protein